jgi:hypothetical protein
MLDLPVTYLCFEQGYISLAELVTPSNSKRNATPLSTLNYEIARADLVKKDDASRVLGTGSSKPRMTTLLW